jgi:hypothetical protein
MFHMLTCFDLEPEASLDEFREALARFTRHMKDIDLVERTGPIGRRQRHPIMDTDDERDHEYYFIMSFRDRFQCDRAVEYILPRKQPVESIHSAVHTRVKDPIFICWEDV